MGTSVTDARHKSCDGMGNNPIETADTCARKSLAFALEETNEVNPKG